MSYKKINNMDFAGMEGLLLHNFDDIEVINIETMEYKDNPSKKYYRVWYWLPK